MFEVRRWYGSGNYYIKDEKDNYMHRDGAVVYDAAEYWRTEEEAQAVLEKFQPKPKHKWEHGDVFENYNGTPMIFIQNWDGSKKMVFCTGSCNFDHPDVGHYFRDATFLFNIKDKL